MAEEIVPILRVSDGYETAKWYARIGFDVQGEHRFAPVSWFSVKWNFELESLAG